MSLFPARPGAQRKRLAVRSGRNSRGRCRCISIERLEPRWALAGEPFFISEFLAVNDSTLADNSGAFSDWIEIHNPSGNEHSLAGYYLTDDPSDLTGWMFPDVSVPAGGFQIVFASGLGVPQGQELHADFRVSSDGEYLALVAPDGQTIVHEFAPEFPRQFADVSYGVGSSTTTTTLLDEGSAARATVPTSGILGTSWTTIGFDDSDWSSGISAVGFDTDAEFSDLIGLDIESEMLGVNASSYARFPFEIPDLSSIDLMTLDMRYGDGFVAYVNGTEVARRNTDHDFSTGGAVTGFTMTGDAELQTLSVDRGDTSYQYDVEELIGITLTHYKGDASARDLSVNFGTPAPPFGARHALLDGDTRLNTGILNPGFAAALPVFEPVIDPLDSDNSTPGMAIRFDTPVVNGAGPDVVLFEIQTSSNPAVGDPFFVSPVHGLGAGLNAIEVDVYDIQFADAPALARIQTYDYTSAPQSIGELESRSVTPGSSPSGFRVLAVGIDLSDMGYAPGATADELFFQDSPSGPGAMDPVFIAGLPPTPTSEISWDAAAASERNDTEARSPERIDLTPFLSVLVEGENILAIHGLNSAPADDDFLVAPRLQVVSVTVDSSQARYFPVPTPGSENTHVAANLGPSITEMDAQVAQPGDDDDMVITARVAGSGAGFDAVTLRYRVMFGSETAVPMLDDGMQGDGAAGDGLFGATIPASASDPGEMVRWYVTATATDGFASRWPLFENAENSPQYFGTVVADDTVETPLPLLEWFVQNTSAANTGTGTRASVYYGGEFYDNVFVRIRGNGARGYPKKSYKFDFNKGYHFRFDDDVARVSEININSTYDDKSYVRQILAYEAFRESGGAYSTAFPLRMQQNGEFYSVAIFVEQVDDEYLARNELSDQGALYKFIGRHGLVGTAGPNVPGARVEKKNRQDEDWSDLNALIDGLALPGEQRENFVFDNVNIAAQVNYMATMILIQNTSGQLGNYYTYRDTEGTGLWHFLPWDMDVTFGPYAGRSDAIDADNDASPRHWSHPFVGAFEFPRDIKGGDAFSNALLDAIYTIPDLQEMYLRRLRSLMDQMLSTDAMYFENRIDQLVPQLGADVILDKARWGADAHFGSTDLSLSAATARLKNEYLAVRRVHLFENHNVDSTYGASVGIPHAQAGNPSMTIDPSAIEFNPASGDQDEEFIPLVNPNDVAVDISGWNLAGGVEYTFPPGTVVPSGATLYVSPDQNAFRSRQSGPAGGQGLYVQGNYSGHISNFGETIELFAADGELIASVQTPVAPSPAQLALRVSELMFHPASPSAEEIAAGFDDADDFEFLELVNIATEPLQLENVRFTDGLGFSFDTPLALPPGGYVVLARDIGAFTLRYGEIDAPLFEYGNDRSDAGLSKLSNGGETIKLDDGDGATILQFTYEDKSSDGWYDEADGAGHSLVVVDVSADPDGLDQPAAWRPSARVGGSPGEDEVAVVPGDVDGDGYVTLADLAILQLHFNQAGGVSHGDFTGDGFVNRADAAVLLRHLGSAPAVAPAPAAAHADVAPSADGRRLHLVGRSHARRDVAHDAVMRDGDQNRRAETAPMPDLTTMDSSRRDVTSSPAWRRLLRVPRVRHVAPVTDDANLDVGWHAR